MFVHTVITASNRRSHNTLPMTLSHSHTLTLSQTHVHRKATEHADNTHPKQPNKQRHASGAVGGPEGAVRARNRPAAGPTTCTTPQGSRITRKRGTKSAASAGSRPKRQAGCVCGCAKTGTATDRGGIRGTRATAAKLWETETAETPQTSTSTTATSQRTETASESGVSEKWGSPAARIDGRQLWFD